MKIKKVEISAFRAYDNIEDSIFDFVLPDDEVADFVSIYAPNGYGKTSFYDAVEWCVTGQIERFHRNRSEYDKLGKENRKANKNNPFFLQHNNQKEIKGSVNVLTNQVEFNRKLTSSTVYDFHKKASEIYFKDVILSQDLVDTFIKEDKADERYKKFVENISSLGSYNNALKNIIKLTENTNDTLTELKDKKEKIEQIQLSLDFDGDEKILEEINKAITNLIDDEEPLSIIQKDKFSKNEFDVLTQKVSSRITTLKIEIDRQDSYIKEIDKSFNGIKSDENRIGVTEYNNQIKKKEKLIKGKKVLSEVLVTLNELKKVEKQLADSTKELDQIIELNKSHTQIKKELTNFFKIESDLDKCKKEIDVFNTGLNEVIDSESKSLSQENDLNIDIKKLQEDIKIREKKLEDLPSIKELLKKIQSNKESIDKSIKSTKKDFDNDQKILDSLNLELKDFIYYRDKIESDIEILLDYSFFNKDKSVIEKILEFGKEIKIIDNSISSLNKKISDQEKLDNELSAFISKGLELVTEKESSSCILCTRQYKSYTELAEKIINNNLLEDSLQNYIKEKSLLSLEKDKKVSESNDYKKDIKNSVESKINSINAKINKKSKEIEKNNRTIELKLEEQLKLNKEEFSLLTFFEEKPTTSFDDLLKKGIDKIQKELNDKSLILDQIKSKRKKTASSKEKITSKISVLKNKIEEIKKRKEYVEVTTYFNEVLKTNTIELEIIEKELNKNSDIISSLKNSISNYQNSIKTKKEFLIKNDKTAEELNNEINRIETLQLGCEKLIQNYEQFILTEYEIDLKNSPQSEINKSFEKLKAQEKNNSDKKNKILKYYLIVENLKDNTYNFLESENTKKDIVELKSKIKIYTSIQSKLNEEKENLESFLKSTIDSFFYTELISALYQKIDPHPNYNLIEFDCDFTEKNPRLQIYTVDKEGNRSIPTLYFSTAQINVLSLSIFLARALKAKNPDTGDIIECIFIDDPVQSMDSINVLSFIDLFRSIIVNLKRQLIVSSHEENFHLLLQKKIPRGLFKSKFINFETFGKLEKDNNNLLMT